MPLDLTDDKSTLVQVMAWCRQATSHYLSQCWPRSMLPNGVTRPQWVNKMVIKNAGPVYTDPNLAMTMPTHVTIVPNGARLSAYTVMIVKLSLVSSTIHFSRYRRLGVHFCWPDGITKTRRPENDNTLGRPTSLSWKISVFRGTHKNCRGMAIFITNRSAPW